MGRDPQPEPLTTTKAREKKRKREKEKGTTVRFDLHITGDNDALVGPHAGAEIRRLLEEVAEKMESYGTGDGHTEASAWINDTNGNIVGGWELKP